MNPRLARALVAWLVARDARLAGRVRPSFEQPGTSGPYVVYTHVSGVRVGNMESRTGEAETRVQIDVWSQDHAEAMEIAAEIRGTGRGSDPAARGLDYHAGSWPDPADADHPVVIQFAEWVKDNSFDDAASPVLGTETGWHRFSADYAITFEEIY
jgi:hypothetical protein